MFLIIGTSRNIAMLLNGLENSALGRLEQNGVFIVATAKEVIDSVVVQLNRALDEVIAKAANGTVTEADLAPLREVAQKLDDLTPDVPETQVSTEPMPEPVEGNPGQLSEEG